MKKYFQDWMLSLASGLTYMHSKQIRHGDIKPENILVKDNMVFLSDFGSSVVKRLRNSPEQLLPIHPHNESRRLHLPSKHNQDHRFAVTLKYCAPEVISNEASSQASDVWSLGCVFAELLTVACGIPLKEFEEYRSKNKVPSPFHNSLDKTSEWMTHLRTLRSNGRASHDSDNIFDTVVMMLRKAPSDRPSAQSVKERLSKPYTDMSPEKGLQKEDRSSILTPQYPFSIFLQS